MGEVYIKGLEQLLCELGSIRQHCLVLDFRLLDFRFCKLFQVVMYNKQTLTEEEHLGTILLTLHVPVKTSLNAQGDTLCTVINQICCLI